MKPCCGWESEMILDYDSDEHLLYMRTGRGVKYKTEKFNSNSYISKSAHTDLCNGVYIKDIRSFGAGVEEGTAYLQSTRNKCRYCRVLSCLRNRVYNEGVWGLYEILQRAGNLLGRSTTRRNTAANEWPKAEVRFAMGGDDLAAGSGRWMRCVAHGEVCAYRIISPPFDTRVKISVQQESGRPCQPL